MRQIAPIYKNDTGISFFWKDGQKILDDKVQLVFKETGFYFSMPELNTFLLMITESEAKNNCCKECEINQRCARFLLKTPCPQIDLAVSVKELDAIRDLVEGTIFKISLTKYVFGDGRN